MASTEPERSLSSGISLPQWMKTKIGDRYDLDETFSPPSHDDSFFYIRYPKPGSRQQTPEPNFKRVSASERIRDQTAKQDFSQHTEQCRQFIPQANMTTTADSGESLVSKSTRLLSASNAEDGDGAACGKSVVQVAHQMIAGNLLRGVSSSNKEEPMVGEGYNKSKRRGSKSLPASPLGSPDTSPDSSPRSHRKYQNRYFTGAFVLERTSSVATGQESANKYPGSWLLSGLLGQQREHTDSSDSLTIQEETHHGEDVAAAIVSGGQVASAIGAPGSTAHKDELRRNKSMTALVSRMFGDSKDEDRVEIGIDIAAVPLRPVDTSAIQKPTAFRAKPSELREMNFWSPTSM